MSDDNRNKLTEEQLKIVENWDRNRDVRLKLLDKLKNNIDDPSVILKEWFDLTSKYCEHGRSISGICAGCDEIERILYPESFEDE